MYKGGFKDDLYHGKGMYTYIDNSVYQGDFENGLRHGIGTYTCNTYKYIGEWKENYKSGIGTYYLLDGYVFEVEIKDNIIVEGTLIKENQNNIELKNIDISIDEKEKLNDIITKNN